MILPLATYQVVTAVIDTDSKHPSQDLIWVPSSRKLKSASLPPFQSCKTLNLWIDYLHRIIFNDFLPISRHNNLIFI